MFLGALACTNETKEVENMNDDTKTTAHFTLAIGTYTQKEGHVDGKAEGLYLYDFNSENGQLSHQFTAKGITNPSYLNIHPNGKVLYACSEVPENTTDKGAPFVAYAFDVAKKSLKEISKNGTYGAYPCYVEVAPDGKNVAVANYGTGNIAVLALDKEGHFSGKVNTDRHEGVGPDTNRQEGPHAHMSTFNPKTGNLYAVDLGTDALYKYKIEGEQLSEPKVIQLPAGSGPRHMAFSPVSDYKYVITELSGKVAVLDGNDQIMQLAETRKDPSLPATGGAIIISADGKHLYASNRIPHNDVAVFSIDPVSGLLTKKGYISAQGTTPRDMLLSPDGKFLLIANQDSSNVTVVQLGENGLKVSSEVFEIPTPVCLKWVK
ncbi:6-phosphogluconolactonase [Persicobacter psychrovividus]|uniref:6-phosphogluconolactonase n=2 Tax=Persicobacter psychrovividus TaxID=387638 RepID=A0ABM7VBJ0_9BACT|nr:6-phosphogluconolactonase [Persicobacter psychrovividus]